MSDNLQPNIDNRLTALESNFKNYEDLSNKVVNKLEIAIDKISSNITNSNQIITTMLAKHDERFIANAQIHSELVEKIKDLKMDINSELKIIRNDTQQLRETFNNFNTNIARDIDLKISNITSETDKKLQSMGNRLDSKLKEFNDSMDTMDTALNSIRTDLYTNTGKTSIINALISAIIAGIITFYFTTQTNTETNKQSEQVEYIKFVS
jgi:2C-methyl-D-erythritol 2,4-cyclodiphosphate synthase